MSCLSSQVLVIKIKVQTVSGIEKSLTTQMVWHLLGHILTVGLLFHALHPSNPAKSDSVRESDNEKIKRREKRESKTDSDRLRRNRYQNVVQAVWFRTQLGTAAWHTSTLRLFKALCLIQFGTSSFLPEL